MLQRFLSHPVPPGPAAVQSQRTTQSPRRPLNRTTYSDGSVTLSFLEWLGAGSATEARPKGDMLGGQDHGWVLVRGLDKEMK